MKVIVVQIIGPQLAQPVAVRAGRLAKALLHAGVDEDALDLGIARGALQHLFEALRPAVGQHVEMGAGLGERARARLLALVAGKPVRGHRIVPDVDVEADLVAGMAGRHRAAARLRHVADEEARPAVLVMGIVGELLEEGNQLRHPPVAVAREAHDLPVWPVDRQLHAAGKAALGIEADRVRRLVGRQLRAREEHFRRRRHVGFLGRERACGEQRERKGRGNRDGPHRFSCRASPVPASAETKRRRHTAL